jgi:hypothetical protein
VGEPDRPPRCSVSVYAPSHLAGQLMIRSMSSFGPDPLFAAMQRDAGNGRKSGLSSDAASTAAPDPKRPLAAHFCCDAQHTPT